MNIITLKEQIKNKTFNETLTILKCSDVTFIASQYIREISESQNRPIVYIESFYDITESMFAEDLSLYVMHVDKLEDVLEDNTSVMKIVVCKSIDKTVEKEMKNFIIEVPKLLPWQTKALLEQKLSGLGEREINWLNDTIKDIYRLDNEMSKISIFSKKEQPQIFRLLNEEDNYRDFNSNTVFNFTNAIVKRDISAIKNILENIDSIDAEPMGVLSILYKSFKNVIDIQLSSNATPESTGMSPKQFNAVRYSVGKYSSKNLIRIFDIITMIDSKLKMGLLPHENIIDYLLINILA